MVACLELCGKSDREITQLLDNADKRGDLGIDPFVPQRIQDYIDKAKVSNNHPFSCIYVTGIVKSSKQNFAPHCADCILSLLNFGIFKMILCFNYCTF